VPGRGRADTPASIEGKERLQCREEIYHMTDAYPQMSDDARALQTHFDGQLAGIRGMVEALSARVESHHTTQVMQIGNMASTLAEVKGDVKAQNGRVTRGEDATKSLQDQVSSLRDRISTIEGQRSGGSGVYTAIMAGIGALVGAAAVALAIAQRGI
jgi:septal ring factor EnvC (AmiA/AmiB activator)